MNSDKRQVYVKKIIYSAKRQRPQADLEIELLKIAGAHGIAPNVIAVDYNRDSCEITMDKISGELLADKYGDDPRAIPPGIWKQIHKILLLLYKSEGIEYIDITPYNFIECDDKVFIIDFGDAHYRGKEQNWFLKEFLGGDFSWNPDFA